MVRRQLPDPVGVPDGTQPANLALAMTTKQIRAARHLVWRFNCWRMGVLARAEGWGGVPCSRSIATRLLGWLLVLVFERGRNLLPAWAYRRFMQWYRV